MHFSTTTPSILAAALATAASAHIPAGQKLDTSDASPKTEMVIGEPQKFSVKGTAVHGGGSCQFALTKGWDPKKDSPWSVIHSIEGGCPARNQKGNLDGANSDGYEFQIPPGIAPGEYTFSWTWNNRIGGQPAETYQNCGLVVVKAAKTKRMELSARRDLVAMSKRGADFPELFMANIGELSGGCTTGEALKQQIAIAYPDPGQSVDRANGDEQLFKQPCDGNPRARKGGDRGSGGSPAPAPAPVPSEPASPPASQPPQPEPSTPSAKPTSAAPIPTSVGPAPEPSSALPAAPSSAAPLPVPNAPGSGGAMDPSSPCTHGQLGCSNSGLEGYSCTGGKWVKIFDVPHSDPPRKCRPGVGNGENLILVDA
ncbi:hypothetical protein PG985_015121 [Apiospora marii]|uniref:uncharacterized protein n=1 Tax=Apiospora marii TaxID=335849 RepID=UPI0031307FE5